MLYQHLPEWTEEKYEKPESLNPIAKLKFEREASKKVKQAVKFR